MIFFYMQTINRRNQHLAQSSPWDAQSVGYLYQKLR